MAVKDRIGQLGTFCAMTPIVDEHAVRIELDVWPTAAESPLARVGPTHFARFVVVPSLEREDARQPPDELGPPYLVFSAFFDGDLDAFLQALCEAMPEEVHGVWRHCHGYPGHPRENADAFRSWLIEHRVPATQVFAADPDVDVAGIRDALAFRRRLRAFVLEPEPAGTRREALAALATEPGA